jgi:hypothetical protein
VIKIAAPQETPQDPAVFEDHSSGVHASLEARIPRRAAKSAPRRSMLVADATRVSWTLGRVIPRGRERLDYVPGSSEGPLAAPATERTPGSVLGADRLAQFGECSDDRPPGSRYSADFARQLSAVVVKVTDRRGNG